mgnify:CR=1 FL=1
MNEPRPTKIVYNTEGEEPVYINNFQLYPVASEIVLDLNKIDYKKTFKAAVNGQPTDIYVNPVITIQLQRDVAMDLLQNLARLLIPQEQQKHEEAEEPKQIEENSGK